MLPVLEEFRSKLDDLMLQCMHSSVLLYGYESYTGRFIRWYAEYYHSIKIDYLVSTDMSRGRAYDQEIFRPSILSFNYKDVKNAIIWIVEPVTDELRDFIAKQEYIEGKTWFDFYGAIYGSDIYVKDDYEENVFKRKKTGKRDIQFLEWLEWKYDCNFVTRISHDHLEVAKEHGEGYGCTTQKEIFPILDHCHCIPSSEDAIFDYGCGKGGALVSFLDYGFERVGGVEFEPKIFEVLKDNIKRIGLQDKIEMLYGDAREIKMELDRYNWFYFYNPFDNIILQKCIENIKNSYIRNRRKIRIIFFSPKEYSCIEATGIFRLTNQFTVDMRQRVVGVFETR